MCNLCLKLYFFLCSKWCLSFTTTIVGVFVIYIVPPFKFSFLVLAFLRFKNRFLIICFCLLIIFSLSVCLFVLMYSIVCLFGAIWSLIKQLCIMIVCLFPKISLDIRFRMMAAIFGLMIFNVLNC